MADDHGMRSAWLFAPLLLLFACGEESSSVPEPKPLTEPVGAHDVSILYPLPAQASQRTSLIGADASGARGELLPEAVFLELPIIDAVLTNQKSYPLLRVVSVRLDPCFPGLVSSEADCKNQIRLVMQPIQPGAGGEFLTANDAAVHLFYELDRTELTTLIATVVELRNQAGLSADEGALGPHPALLVQGIEGAFAQGLRDALLSYAGEQTLTRVTFMALEPLGGRWTFGGFDRQAGKLVPMTIPTTTATTQSFDNDDSSGAQFEGAAITPASGSADDLSLFLNPALADQASADQRTAALRAALRIENPTSHSPDTIDCVSCHVAMAARLWGEQNLALSAEGLEEQFTVDGAVVDGATVKQTTELRAFGHFGRRTSISQRTVNETASVVDYVNEHLRTQ